MSENAIRSFTFTPSDGVPPAVAPFAHATAAGPTLYVTGQMPTDVTGALVGGGVADVVQARAYLTEWDDYADFNAAYARWFPERLPSRTCVGTTGLAAGARVEVDLVAWRSGGW